MTGTDRAGRLAPFGVAVSPTGQTVYVTNSFDNTVSVIAVASNTVTATIPVGASPSGIAAAPNGNSVYVSNSADNTVSVIASNNTVSSTVPVGAAAVRDRRTRRTASSTSRTWKTAPSRC